MKVICINTTGWETLKKFLWLRWKEDTAGPQYGDILTVEWSYWGDGILFYRFTEWPGEDWQSDCFIPLSSIDETTFEREYNKQTV